MSASGLPTAKGKIDVNYHKCIGCLNCVYACATRDRQDVNLACARIRIYQFFPGPLDIPVLCHQCSNHPCVAACPENALTVLEGGVVSVNADSCTGCRKCHQACPHQAVFFDPQTRKANICNLCGGSPRCVADCPTQALTFYAGSSFDGRHYARKTAADIAAALAQQYHPLTADSIPLRWPRGTGGKGESAGE